MSGNPSPPPPNRYCRFASVRRRCDPKAWLLPRAISVRIASALFSPLYADPRPIGHGRSFHSPRRRIAPVADNGGGCRSLCLALLGRRSEAPADSLAVHPVGQPWMRTMTRIVETMTMTTRVTAPPTGSSDRPGAKIFQFGNLPSGLRPAFVPDRQHGMFGVNRAYHIRSPVGVKKRNLPIPQFHVAHVARLTAEAVINC